MDLEGLEHSLWLQELRVVAQMSDLMCRSHKTLYIVELCYNHVSWERSNRVVFHETEALLSLPKIQGISGNPSVDNLFLKNIKFSTKVNEKM